MQRGLLQLRVDVRPAVPDDERASVAEDFLAAGDRLEAHGLGGGGRRAVVRADQGPQGRVALERLRGDRGRIGDHFAGDAQLQRGELTGDGGQARGNAGALGLGPLAAQDLHARAGGLAVLKLGLGEAGEDAVEIDEQGALEGVERGGRFVGLRSGVDLGEGGVEPVGVVAQAEDRSRRKRGGRDRRDGRLRYGRGGLQRGGEGRRER